MIWTNDNLPDSIVFPMGPIDIVDNEITWDDRFGPQPEDMREFILQSA